MRINPEANVRAVQANLDNSNVEELVGSVDIVFDTIDFLDLEAILGLHLTAKALGKPVFTALSAGPGSAILYCPAGSDNSLADIIQRDVQAAQAEGDASYASVFGKIMARIGAGFDRQVLEQVAKALTIMEDGRPCPASQIAAGSFGVAAHAVTMMHDMLAGLEVPEAPYMVVHNYRTRTTRLVNIGD
jgi:molybdopterin/thiamine biosynthesis adenylyltransferase